MIHWLLQILQTLQGEPLWSSMLLLLLACASGILMLPLFAFEVCSGWFFGPWMAYLIMSLAIWLIVPSSLFLGRTLLKNRVQKLLAMNPKADYLLRALEKKGFMLMVLVRMSPFTPFGMTNYALSLSRLPWWKVTFATWIGASPLLLAMIWIGVESSHLGHWQAPSEGMWSYGLGAAVMALLLWLVTRTIKRALAEFEV